MCCLTKVWIFTLKWGVWKKNRAIRFVTREAVVTNCDWSGTCEVWHDVALCWTGREINVCVCVSVCAWQERQLKMAVCLVRGVGFRHRNISECSLNPYFVTVVCEYCWFNLWIINWKPFITADIHCSLQVQPYLYSRKQKPFMACTHEARQEHIRLRRFVYCRMVALH